MYGYSIGIWNYFIKFYFNKIDNELGHKRQKLSHPLIIAKKKIYRVIVKLNRSLNFNFKETNTTWTRKIKMSNNAKEKLTSDFSFYYTRYISNLKFT